jgi:hypothetical protein
MNINFQKRQTKEDIRSVTGNRAVKRSVERCAVVERKWNSELMKLRRWIRGAVAQLAQHKAKRWECLVLSGESAK